MCGQLRLVDRSQLRVHPGRAAEVRPSGQVARVQELAVQRLEVLAPHHVPVLEAELCRTVADPSPGGLATLLPRRPVVPGTAPPRDPPPVRSPDPLERV